MERKTKSIELPKARSGTSQESKTALSFLGQTRAAASCANQFRIVEPESLQLYRRVFIEIENRNQSLRSSEMAFGLRDSQGRPGRLESLDVGHLQECGGLNMDESLCSTSGYACDAACLCEELAHD